MRLLIGAGGWWQGDQLGLHWAVSTGEISPQTPIQNRPKSSCLMAILAVRFAIWWGGGRLGSLPDQVLDHARYMAKKRSPRRPIQKSPCRLPQNPLV